jgi:hypothetical protein
MNLRERVNIADLCVLSEGMMLRGDRYLLELVEALCQAISFLLLRRRRRRTATTNLVRVEMRSFW